MSKTQSQRKGTGAPLWRQYADKVLRSKASTYPNMRQWSMELCSVLISKCLGGPLAEEKKQRRFICLLSNIFLFPFIRRANTHFTHVDVLCDPINRCQLSSVVTAAMVLGINVVGHRISRVLLVQVLNKQTNQNPGRLGLSGASASSTNNIIRNSEIPSDLVPVSFPIESPLDWVAPIITAAGILLKTIKLQSNTIKMQMKSISEYYDINESI